MSVTCGSIGDIIAVGTLVKNLLATLDETRGSRAEYRTTIQAIKLLDDIISLLNQQVIQPGVATPELRTECETARQAVARCSRLGPDLLNRIRRYQTIFDETHKPNKLKETAMAVRWRFGEKHALERFYVEIVGTSLSLQTLLATANLTLLSVNRKDMKDKLDEAKCRSDATILSQNVALDNIKAGNSILLKVSEAPKFDRIRQVSSELKGMVRDVMAVNFAIYRGVIRLETKLSSHLERGLWEDPMILEDPIGRIMPVNLQFVTSWDAFHSALEIRFRNMPGHSKMRQRRYGLQAGGTGREIEMSYPWQNVFLPGQRVEMSFIFDDRGSGTTCPGCQTPLENLIDADIHCKNCQLSFRRIYEVETSTEQNNLENLELITESNDSRTDNRKR